MSILVIQDNKKARFDYEILETFEAGIVLMGSEVKSLRDKSIQLKDSYISFINNEAFLQNAHISPYKASSYNNHEPERLRKLLLHREELEKIFAKIREKGLSCVPLKIFFKKGLVKLDIALVRGKKLHDKRESIKTRDENRRMKQSSNY
ncbi:MAG: SsrA-binding protein SmpB [Bdellovibrionaceae bacterium]|nr:SsrA-binding protein SmpB [Pseudobdellovibrionaceae bacterium]NUM59520.1 SsrA-binding protein SmpB [Pseudobdellovibrionaceae bacterium]